AHQAPTHLIDRHPLVWLPHTGNDESLSWLARDVHRLAQNAASAVLEQIDRLARPDRIVASSRFAADRLARIHADTPIDVVYPGIDRDSLERPASALKIKAPYLVADFEANDGWRLALEALRLELRLR